MEGVGAEQGNEDREWVAVERLMTPLAVLAVAAFVIWGLVLIDQIVDNVYLSSDAAAPLVLAENFDDRGTGEIIMGNSPWYEPLYALKLTRWLPQHVDIWKVGPLLLYGLILAITAWTVSRTVSRRAGLLVALAMASPGPGFFLTTIGAPNSHGHTLFHAVLLAAFLVTLPRLNEWGWSARALWALALAATLAPGASSDVLLIIGGALPFLVTIGFAAWSGIVRKSIGALAAGGCVVGVLAGRILAHLAQDTGIRTSGAEFPLAPAGEVFANIRRLLVDVATFAHGELGGEARLVNGVLELVALVAMVAVPVILYRSRSRFLTVVNAADRPSGQRMLAVYWAAAVAALTVAFISSTAPDDPGSARFVLILWPALLTLGVILYPRRAPAVIATVAAVAAALGCIQLARGDYTAPISRAPRGAQLERIEEFVTARGADLGYAGYWDAMTITLQTEFELSAYPVEPCADGVGLCPFSISREDSWYIPRPGIRSFYLVNPVGAQPRVPPPPPIWGPPLATGNFDGVAVYIYEFDLASELRPVP